MVEPQENVPIIQRINRYHFTNHYFDFSREFYFWCLFLLWIIEFYVRDSMYFYCVKFSISLAWCHNNAQRGKFRGSRLWSSKKKKKKRNYVSLNKSVRPGSSFQISHNTLVRCSFVASLGPTFFVVVVVVHHTTLALHRPSSFPLAPSSPWFASEADSSYFRFPATI